MTSRTYDISVLVTIAKTEVTLCSWHLCSLGFSPKWIKWFPQEIIFGVRYIIKGLSFYLINNFPNALKKEYFFKKKYSLFTVLSNVQLTSQKVAAILADLKILSPKIWNCGNVVWQGVTSYVWEYSLHLVRQLVAL